MAKATEDVTTRNKIIKRVQDKVKLSSNPAPAYFPVSAQAQATAPPASAPASAPVSAPAAGEISSHLYSASECDIKI